MILWKPSIEVSSRVISIRSKRLKELRLNIY